MPKQPAWLKEDGLQQLFAATREAGGEARAVGGAVRDFLLGRTVDDIDVASSLKPEATMALAQRAGWKAIPTGLAHGTLTLVLPERTVEVTTLRRDVSTDGRHAEVAFTDDFAEDAARRDFTINALYMDAQGAIYDYHEGQADLAAHRVRFIGDAAQRIAEDGLRILRFFRFLATHGTAPADAAAIAACRDASAMLDALSGERIAQEMRKLLVSGDPCYALAEMASGGFSERLIGVKWVPKPLLQLMELGHTYGVVPNPWLRLLAMVPPESRAQVAAWVGERWKLSRAERALLAALPIPLVEANTASVKEWLRQHPRDVVEARLLLLALDTHVLPMDDWMVLVHEWPIPQLPVTAKDLLAKGYSEGKVLGDTLKALEQRWVESDYELSRSALLEDVEVKQA